MLSLVLENFEVGKNLPMKNSIGLECISNPLLSFLEFCKVILPLLLSIVVQQYPRISILREKKNSFESLKSNFELDLNDYNPFESNFPRFLYLFLTLNLTSPVDYMSTSKSQMGLRPDSVLLCVMKTQ